MPAQNAEIAATLDQTGESLEVQGGNPFRACAKSCCFDEIVAFLRQPSSYPAPSAVETIETHMSLIFLVGERVYKMKKPLRLSFVDFTALDARRRNCERELELNQALAPGVYREVVAVVRRNDGRLGIGGEGKPVEWLLVMTRLDQSLLLGARIRGGTARPSDIAGLGEMLARFYGGAPRIVLTAAEHLQWWTQAIARAEVSLRDFASALPERTVTAVLSGLRRFLADDQALLADRATAGRIVDGHGDLRPEHVFIGPPLMLLDRLEFDARLRWADPFDEAMFLGLECERLGAPWVGPQLVASLEARLDDEPPPALLAFYRRHRACMRASLSIEHLRDARPRTPERWPRQAADYLDLALRAGAAG
jgi:aminoglycoside phosphotransferase family enzyme